MLENALKSRRSFSVSENGWVESERPELNGKTQVMGSEEQNGDTGSQATGRYQNSRYFPNPGNNQGRYFDADHLPGNISARNPRLEEQSNINEQPGYAERPAGKNNQFNADYQGAQYRESQNKTSSYNGRNDGPWNQYGWNGSAYYNNRFANAGYGFRNRFGNGYMNSVYDGSGYGRQGFWGGYPGTPFSQYPYSNEGNFVSNKGKGPKNFMRSDERIEDNINECLTDDPFIDASDIEVSVKNNEVTLNGYVSSKEAKRRAEDIAESIYGVVNVENRLHVTDQQMSSTLGKLSVNAEKTKRPDPVMS
jgi:HSP20 family molecular chaperone IbpA